MGWWLNCERGAALRCGAAAGRAGSARSAATVPRVPRHVRHRPTPRRRRPAAPAAAALQAFTPPRPLRGPTAAPASPMATAGRVFDRESVLVTPFSGIQRLPRSYACPRRRQAYGIQAPGHAAHWPERAGLAGATGATEAGRGRPSPQGVASSTSRHYRHYRPAGPQQWGGWGNWARGAGLARGGVARSSVRRRKGAQLFSARLHFKLSRIANEIRASRPFRSRWPGGATWAAPGSSAEECLCASLPASFLLRLGSGSGVCLGIASYVLDLSVSCKRRARVGQPQFTVRGKNKRDFANLQDCEVAPESHSLKKFLFCHAFGRQKLRLSATPQAHLLSSKQGGIHRYTVTGFCKS